MRTWSNSGLSPARRDLLNYTSLSSWTRDIAPWIGFWGWNWCVLGMERSGERSDFALRMRYREQNPATKEAIPPSESDTGSRILRPSAVTSVIEQISPSWIQFTIWSCSHFFFFAVGPFIILKTILSVHNIKNFFYSSSLKWLKFCF